MEPIFLNSTAVLFGQLLLAAILGMVLGTERSVVAEKRAGMRTYALVSLGSCLFSVISIWVTSSYFGLANFDPMRVPAGIITGIGFIGAGLIFFQGDKLQGLTSAAGLWVAAGIGIAVAFGLYAVAVFSTLLTLGIFTGLWFIEDRLKGLNHAPGRLRVVKETKTEAPDTL